MSPEDPVTVKEHLQLMRVLTARMDKLQHSVKLLYVALAAWTAYSILHTFGVV